MELMPDGKRTRCLLARTPASDGTVREPVTYYQELDPGEESPSSRKRWQDRNRQAEQHAVSKASKVHQPSAASRIRPHHHSGPHAPGGVWRYQNMKRCRECSNCIERFKKKSIDGVPRKCAPCEYWLDMLDYTDEERSFVLDPANRELSAQQSTRHIEIDQKNAAVARALATNCKECGWYVPDLPDVRCKCGHALEDLPDAARMRRKAARQVVEFLISKLEWEASPYNTDSDKLGLWMFKCSP